MIASEGVEKRAARRSWCTRRNRKTFDRPWSVESLMRNHEIPLCPLCLCVLCVEHNVQQRATMSCKNVVDGFLFKHRGHRDQWHFLKENVYPRGTEVDQ